MKITRSLRYVPCYPNLDIARNCLANTSPWQFWSISEFYLHLIEHLHLLKGNFGLNGGVLWFTNTDGQWRGGREGVGGRGVVDPIDNFLGALKSNEGAKIRNCQCEMLYKICKVQFVNKFKDSSNSCISIYSIKQ